MALAAWIVRQLKAVSAILNHCRIGSWDDFRVDLKSSHECSDLSRSLVKHGS